MTTSEQKVDAALSTIEIRNLGRAYCRAMDRCDADLLKTIWQDGATVKYGVFDGDAREFSDFITAQNLKNSKRLYHTISNDWIEVRGNEAVGEVYVIAVSSADQDGQEKDHFVGGRYIDRYERRNGTWKIAHRSFVLDWHFSQDSTAQWDEGMYGMLKLRGDRGSKDPVQAFWRE